VRSTDHEAPAGTLVMVPTGGAPHLRKPDRRAGGAAQHLQPRICTCSDSFHDSERVLYIDPPTLAPEELKRRTANMATRRAIAGEPCMHDPELLGAAGADRRR